MLKAEQVNICFEELAIEEMAKVSYELNQEDNKVDKLTYELFNSYNILDYNKIKNELKSIIDDDETFM